MTEKLSNRSVIASLPEEGVAISTLFLQLYINVHSRSVIPVFAGMTEKDGNETEKLII